MMSILPVSGSALPNATSDGAATPANSMLPLDFASLIALHFDPSIPQGSSKNAIAEKAPQEKAESDGLSSDTQQPATDILAMMGLAAPPQAVDDAVKIATDSASLTQGIDVKPDAHPAREDSLLATQQTKPDAQLSTQATAIELAKTPNPPPTQFLVPNAVPATTAAPADEASSSAILAASDTPSPQGVATVTGMLQHGTPQASAPSHTQTTASIHTPLDHPAWGNQFNEKVVWMSKDNIQSAVINITPPQLGPIQVTLSMDGNQASASFASPHAQVREAIQSSISELRDMLSANGISLGQANIGSNPQQQQQFSQSTFTAKSTQNGGENAILQGATSSANTVVSETTKRGRGMVDLFA